MDGALVDSSDPIGETFAAPDASFRIGADMIYGTRELVGAADDIIVYSRALGDAEIQALFEVGSRQPRR